MAINNVEFGNYSLNLTGDTVTAEKLFNGITAHNKAGNPIVGTYIAPSFITVHSGGSAPSNSLGNNGDIYLQS